MFLVCLGYQVSYLVMSSTLIVTIVNEVFDLDDSSFLGTKDAFRMYATIITFLIVLPISSMRRLKDFLIITILQILVII